MYSDFYECFIERNDNPGFVSHIITPLFFGFIFGTRIVVGILGGSLVSGVQCALSASNTGGAWDNAKKYIKRVYCRAAMAKARVSTGQQSLVTLSAIL